MATINVSSNGTRYGQNVSVRDFQFVADEPSSIGGDDRGATPMEYVLAGLGACKAITIRMYAERRGWSLDTVDVQINYERSSAKEKPFVQAQLIFSGDLDEAQRARLKEIGDRCPVHRFLSEQLTIETTIDHP
ncbi:OsmC family protein [[Limnothrix rosea] IAM M-220]|uniref:OsmC family protein n=1 Tax=[Limnothrix rosea] IAM M-220 TaxID=454133 RepID=UPI00095D16F3|nr:OsmC family protein [[Limnothrix rosea] IAM M-220]OKH17984.1 osmotically inducible protein OsmC [[Limnothrix rosea] IAM M-220]